MAKSNCVTFVWKIQNLQKTNREVSCDSPEFYVNCLRESGWLLQLNIPSSFSEEVNINLQNKYYQEGPGLLSIDFEISIVAASPSKTISHFKENIAFSMNSFLKVNGFPSWSILTKSNRDEYFREDILTIQCKLWKRNLKYKDLTPLFYQAYSRYAIRKISHNWSLNFNHILDGNEIQSKKLFLDKKQPIFHVETFIEPLHNNLGFLIEQRNSDFDNLQLSCKISVIDGNEKVSKQKEWYVDMHFGILYRFSSFISTNYLKENSEKCMKHNELKLILDFTYKIEDIIGSISYDQNESISKFPPAAKPIIQSQDTPSIQTLSAPNLFFLSTPSLPAPEKKTTVDAGTLTDKEIDINTSALKGDFHDMYLSNLWSDVVLEAQGCSFPCHRCILSARSPVFRSLLSESSNTITLKLKMSVLSSMLHFIYTGDIGVPMDFQNAMELYEASSEYQITSLKNLCSTFLKNNMTEQNACDALILASKHGDVSLKANTESFILKRAATVIVSSRWKDLVKKDAKYVVETMHKIFLEKNRKNSYSLLQKLQEIGTISDKREKSTEEHHLNFLSIYLCSLFSDLDLCTKSGKTFSAHKNILWARSPVFKALLSDNIQESSRTSLHIPEMDEQTAEQFLRFLYSGKIVEAEFEVLSNLYLSADKYQVLSLKERCAKSLVTALSVKNVCEILMLSDQNQDEKLKNEVLDFITKNDKSVILSPEWKNVMKTNPKLVSETVLQIYTRKENMDLVNSQIETETSLHSESTHQSCSENDAATVLQVDLVSLYEEKSFSDCQLCTNDKTFEVHKNILCARSPVLNAMFSSDLEEATTNTLVIPDIDGETVDQMLRYLYTATFEDSGNVDIYKLYYAADKYQINSLKDRCSHLLRQKISVDNVCGILLLADRHGDKGLEKAVQNFMINNSKEVFNSASWKAFMSDEPQVSCETMLAIY